MRIVERELTIPAPRSDAVLAEVDHLLRERLPEKEVPVRFAVASSDRHEWHCEVGVLEDFGERALRVEPVLRLRRRRGEDSRHFNVVFVVPTGIGSDIGGHAGDAMPAAKLAASVSDLLVTHPNVLNGSDIMELPDNALYVEGSIISRLLTGEVGLRRVRSNRVLVVIDEHELTKYRDAAVNSVNAARASLGLDAPEVVSLERRVKLRSRFTTSGSAVGEVGALAGLFELLDEREGSYDAVALSTQVEVPFNYHVDYYEAKGEMVNPWGGAEAIFTHSLSSLYDVPTAHAPMLESKEVEDLDLGVVDPRMAAEAISTAFFYCVLKGLQKSPRIVPMNESPPDDVLTAEQVSCLVIPDGAVGIPTLAALEQDIKVIAVRENRNVLHNDLTALPWAPGQLHVVENYWEAVGVLAALRTGVDPQSVRRPLGAARQLVKQEGAVLLAAATADGSSA